MDWIGLSEGGYVNHKDDPGGPTDRGITQRVYDAWCRANGQRLRSVKGISKYEAEEILATQYFAPVRFDDLPSGLDYAMVDYGINSGAARAITALQKIVGVKADGVLGLITLAAIKARPTDDLIVALCNERWAFVQRLKTFKTFGKGWKARIMGAAIGVQDGDIGVIDRAVRLSRHPKQGVNAPSIPAPKPSVGHATGKTGLQAFLAAILALFGIRI